MSSVIAFSRGYIRTSEVAALIERDQVTTTVVLKSGFQLDVNLPPIAILEILASHDEEWGRVYLEAMAQKVAAVR